MRPRLRQLALTIATLLIVPGAEAASYRFTSAPYGAGNIMDFTAPCGRDSCANYAPTMWIAGTFSTAAPLAANLVSADIYPLVTNFQFSDGITTYDSSGPGTRALRFQVSTDASGQITGSDVEFMAWQDNLAGPHSVGNPLNVVAAIAPGAGSGWTNGQCISIGMGPLVADSCISTALDGNVSYATSPSGAWATLPDITINDVSASEGNAGTTNFTFTVSISAVPTAPVSVNWATADGTATGGSDYSAASGTLNWLAGDNSARTITVQVSGDGAVEANETFTVNLNNVTGAGLASAQGTGTITNDDLPPPDLALTKTDGAASTVPGATVAYTLTCANNSGQPASGVMLTETVPANTTFNAGASTAGWICLPNANAGSTCTYSVGSLSVGGWDTATFAVDVASPLAEAVTQISNTASCTDDGSHGADPVPADNSATDIDAVVHPQVPPTLGNVPDQSGTVGMAFSLALAPWVTLTNGDAVTGYAIASGSLPPGLTLDAGSGIISGIPTAAGTYDLTVTASDDDGVSNSDAVRMTISAAAVSTARPVPTLTEWGTLLLAGLLLASTLRLPTSCNRSRR